MTRKQSTETDNAETDSVQAAPAIPSDVQADVTVKYKTRVGPNQDSSTRSRQQELAELVELAEEDGPLPLPLDTPLDELSEFCSLWANFIGYPLTIVRHPDPPERKMYGQGYARACNQTERLGDIAFDPANLTSAIQSLNHNSGGVFRLWLNGLNGAPIPDARARIERFAIADPPRAQREATQTIAQPLPAPAPAPPPPPQKSESERQLDTIKDQLFTTALQRALNPASAPVQPTAPALPPEQQAMLYLLGNSELVPNLVRQMTTIAQQAAGIEHEPSIKERAIDAATEIIKSNPLIIDRVTNVVDRIIGRIFGPDSRYDALAPQQFTPQQFQQSPATQPQPTATQSQSTTVDDELAAAIPGDESDDDTMDIIDSILGLINSDKPLTAETLNDPVILELQRRYPVKFRFAIRMIIASSLADIIEWIKDTGGPAYVIMLDGPASGPFLRQRLGELQKLIIEGKKQHEQQKTNQQQTAQAPTTTSTPDVSTD